MPVGRILTLFPESIVFCSIEFLQDIITFHTVIITCRIKEHYSKTVDIYSIIYGEVHASYKIIICNSRPCPYNQHPLHETLTKMSAVVRDKLILDLHSIK